MNILALILQSYHYQPYIISILLYMHACNSKLVIIIIIFACLEHVVMYLDSLPVWSPAGSAGCQLPFPAAHWKEEKDIYDILSM